MIIKMRNEATGEMVEVNVDGTCGGFTKEQEKELVDKLEAEHKARLVSGEKEFELEAWKDKS